MNLLTNILDFFRPDKKVEKSEPNTYLEEFIAGSHIDEYRKRLDNLNLMSMDDLEKLILPIVRPATKIEVQ
jgi:hypothetical protein